MILEFFNKKSIKSAAIGSLIVKFLSALSAFLIGLFLARDLGLESFGVYTVAFTTILVLSVPVSLGLPTLITRYVSKYEVENNYSAIKGLLIRANQIVIIISLLVFTIAAVSYLLWWKNYDKELVDAIIYSFLLLPLIALGSLRAAALRGLKFIVLGQLPDTFLRNFIFLILLITFKLTEQNLTPALAIQMHIIAALLAFIVGAYFLHIKLGRKTNMINAIYFNKHWLNQALPFSLNSGIQVLKNKLSTYVLVIFGSLESVALFDVATRGASLVAFTLDALNTAIAPYISSEFEKNNMVSLQSIVTKTSRIIFFFAVPVVIVFVIGGEKLIDFLFGKEYNKAYLPLVILCFGQLINAATGSVGLVLNMTGRQAYFTKIAVYMAVLNTLLCIPFVIWFDVKGAALLTALIIISQNIILVKYVFKDLKINTTIIK
jgi:O-antigen/teichoic acid export membrane protein